MSTAVQGQRDLVVKTVTDDGIATLRFNNPDKLNAWSTPMLEALRVALADVAADASVRAVIVTGTGKYYCAGVDFAGAMRPMHPRALKEMIRSSNYALFDQFIAFPKPIFAAVNGPSIGAAVTSASLMDAIIASPSATFYTPFKALGVVPEGCSSFLFPRLMGEEQARRFLEDGEKVTASDARDLGLVAQVVPADDLMSATEAYAREWLGQGKPRAIVADGLVDKLREVNAAESIALANAICDYPFLDSMIRFTRTKKKWGPLAMFSALRLTRPIWSRL